MAAEGHLLVTGGPGSGKTTIAIMKAAQVVEQKIMPYQKILFLSFARATVSRILEAIDHEQKISVSLKSQIEVDTYHAFFWRILKTHGYLLGLPRKLNVLTPHAEAVELSKVRSNFLNKDLSDEQKKAKKNAEEQELARLAKEEGRVCFDFFASYIGEILHGSERICCLVSCKYPVIILDEFQDTDNAQWYVVQALGKYSRLITLADPEQQIYGWKGADPERINHFRKKFSPSEVNLGADNHRSKGTEIAIFGDDILTGKFRQKNYKGVKLDVFDSYQNMAITKLVTTVYRARSRLIEQGIKNWSLAILVPTKKLTRTVSNALYDPPAKMTAIQHTAVIDMEATLLAAEVIAFLMQPSDKYRFSDFIDMLCNYFLGKGGDKLTQKAMREAEKIRSAYDTLLRCQVDHKKINKNSIIVNIQNVYDQACHLVKTGSPDRDWRAIRDILENGKCKRLQEIAREVRNVRILNRGMQLQQMLARDWRDTRYSNALAVIRQVFNEEYLSTRIRPESGVIVMNMHKAKGKQFDEVIIFEGWPNIIKGKIQSNHDRIVRSNSKDEIDKQCLQNLRVSVTRSKRQTTILTPRSDPCLLLPV